MGKTYRHYWNNNIDKWERAFKRLKRDIYFVFSYGEAFGSHGFYECVDMIGKHPTWTLNIITNLSFSPERVIHSRLGQDKRVFITACWHPLGVHNPVEGWKTFTTHLLMLKAADIPTHVMMVWYRPQIPLIPDVFEWLDRHDIRFSVRRYVHDTIAHPLFRKILRRVAPKSFAGKIVLDSYTDAEREFLYASTSPKVTKYGLNMSSTYGKLCYAGKDMLLIKHDGTAALCACCYGSPHRVGNIFSSTFKPRTQPTYCPTNTCGGDFGMVVLPDEAFGVLPNQMWKDTFISQTEHLPQGHPVPYPHREEMMKWLEVIRRKPSQS